MLIKNEAVRNLNETRNRVAAAAGKPQPTQQVEISIKAQKSQLIS